MFGGNGDGQIAGSILVPHVFLRLHKVFGDGGADFVRISMELQHAFRLGTIGKPIFLQEFPESCQPKFPAVFRLSEQSLRIKGELFNLGRQSGGRRVGRKILPRLQLLQTGKHVLEHTRSRAGCRNKLALPVNPGLSIIGDGPLHGRFVQDKDPTFRGGRSNNLHPRETLFKMFDLLIDLPERTPSLLKLSDVFLVEHNLCG